MNILNDAYDKLIESAETVESPTLFQGTGYVPGDVVISLNGVAFNIATLPPFLRVLMVTDGTVTKCIEAHEWERVVVRPLSQFATDTPAESNLLIALRDGEEVLQREVCLEGATSGRVFVYARSCIRHGILSPRLRDDLLAQRIGIGELIQECGLETYREVLDMGYCDDPEVSQHLPAADCIVYRCYRVRLSGMPIMTITEYFSLNQFR